MAALGSDGLDGRRDGQTSVGPEGRREAGAVPSSEGPLRSQCRLCPEPGISPAPSSPRSFPRYCLLGAPEVPSLPDPPGVSISRLVPCFSELTAPLTLSPECPGAWRFLCT